MSADDFQTKYASVMESMLKSAIAETTKLFENMVDELKAEISQIKKENEDLKSKCFQYEVAKSQPAESSTDPEQSDASGKCDSGVQCDLVPYRTVVVEQCEPLVESAQQVQEQQCTYDLMGYAWQEHNYVSYGDKDSRMAFVLVKQEDDSFLQSTLKQEEEESDGVSGHGLNKTGASVAVVEHKGPRINQESSTEQISSSQKTAATPVVLQLPSLGTDSSSQIAQNQPSGLNHSLVISLKDALREDIKEENEVCPMTTKTDTSEDQLVPEEHHLDKASLPNEQTEVNVKQHGDVPCTDDPLAGSGLVMKANLPDVDANPHLPECPTRGHPPKKTKQKHIFESSAEVPREANTSSSKPSGASAIKVLEVSSISSPSVKKNSNTSIEEKKSETGSSSLSVDSLSSSFSSEKQSTLKSSQLFIEVEKKGTRVRLFRGLSASETPNSPQSESPQAPLGECHTPVSLQDAMLLIEAMNQSTVENTVSLTQITAPPLTLSAPVAGPSQIRTPHTGATLVGVSSHMTGRGLSNDTMLQNSGIIPKQLQCAPTLNNTTLPVSSSVSSTAATQTVIQSLPLPRIKVGPPVKVPRTIIILPRPALSYTSHNTVGVSKTQPSAVDSTASQKIHTPPSSLDVELSSEKPSHSSSPPKTIKVTYSKLDPVSPLQSTTVLTDHQYVIPPCKKITIIPKQFPAVTKPVVQTVKQDIIEPEPVIDAPEPEPLVDIPEPEPVVDIPEPEPVVDIPELEASVSLSSTNLSSMSLELSLTASDETLMSESNNTTDSPNSSSQTAAVFETITPCTSTETSVKEVQTSVSSGLPPTAEEKLYAVVRLTRLPFPVSTEESILVSTLQAKGFSFISEKQPRPSISLSASRGPPVASNLTELSSQPLTFNQLTADLDQDAVSSEGEEDQKEGLILPISIIADDIFDPHLQLTKTKFLEQLSVSPLQSESSCSVQQKSSIVSRLRSHLKPLMKARRSATEEVTDEQTENRAKNLKKSQFDSDSVNGTETTKEPVGNITSLNTISNTSTKRSGHWKDDDSPTKIGEKVSVSSRNSGSTNDAAAESFKRLRSSPVCPGRPTYTNRSEGSENGSLSQTTKFSCSSPKRSTKAVASPEKTISVRENTSPKGSGSPNSTPIKVSPNTKPIKRESSSFSPSRCTISKVDAVSENMIETDSPTSKCLKMVKNSSSPERSQKLTPDKKPRPVQGCHSPKTNQAVKLTTRAKASRRKRVRRSNAEKLKRQNQTKGGVVKKCRAKVWYPPTLPPNEVPSTEIIKAPRLKVEYRVPVIPENPKPIVSPLQPLAFIGRHLLRNQCGECGRVFNSTNALESHVSLHKFLRPFTCKLCGKCFPDSITFKRHDRVHRNGRIHICPQCGKGFVYRFGLSKHIQMVHSRLKPFICQICNKSFFNKRDVEIHQRIHTGEKPFECHVCERRFTRKVELNVHLRWHNGEKRHWCSYCGKGFLDSNNLKRHKYIHTGERPFSCPHCPKTFSQTGHMKKHVQNVHKATNT
ncbi:putative GPI-anchored protein pfl2 [Kryptolebias marmoratus]|uniref:Putative GPI-anchored protein pfl2 n=1 Tax=Kryptolebias marmoratus TaxID=37003 RepID=A0A3Q2ZCM4_KRYMA|nr:putative GPI-anchored protein pfl2 [Kryptolebias marmoratus]